MRGLGRYRANILLPVLCLFFVFLFVPVGSVVQGQGIDPIIRGVSPTPAAPAPSPAPPPTSPPPATPPAPAPAPTPAPAAPATPAPPAPPPPPPPAPAPTPAPAPATPAPAPAPAPAPPASKKTDEDKAPELFDENLKKEILSLNKTGTTSVPELIGKVIAAVLGIIGAVTLLMLVYGGVTWMTAEGNSEKTSKAMKIIVWAAMGAVAVLSSLTIVQFIFEIF